MALNVFKLKKWGGLLLTAMLPTLMFYIALMMWGFLFAIIFFLVGSLLGALLGSKFIKNPFTEMLEGKGLLTFVIDSTGVIRPFVSSLVQPYIKGKLGKEKVDDVYDAESVMRLAEPIKGGKVQALKTDKGGIRFKLTENDFNKSRYKLYQYPVLIYNAQIKSCITKDFLSEGEKQAFAEHGVLYLNRKVEELTSTMRDFGRYIVELTKPKGSIWENKWVRIVAIVLIVCLLIILAKPLISNIVKAGGGGGVLSNFGSAVNPR